MIIVVPLKAKVVDVEKLVGQRSSLTGEDGSMTMAHLWACDGKGTSLTLISWIPTVQRRGQEPLKTDSLMNLLKFLTLLRRSSNLRVRDAFSMAIVGFVDSWVSFFADENCCLRPVRIGHEEL